MSGNATDTAELRLLDWAVGHSPTAPTTPMKLALVTAAGSDSAAGTEVTGGSYARQTVTFASASGGSVASDADVTFADMPACTVVGIEVWDSTGTPVRWFYGPLTVSKSVGAGDSFVVSSGTLTISLD